MTTRTFDVEAALKDDRWIRGLALGLLQEGSEADDALQEARLALMRSPPSRLSDPRPWLATVALNFLRKRRREELRRKEREHRAARPERVLSSPEDAMERVELRRQVLEAVLALDEPYRSTLVLRFFEEMSLKEIAGCGNVPVNTVKTRVSRALSILRRRLEALHGREAVWAALLLPFLAPGSRAACAPGGASAPAMSATGSGFGSWAVANTSFKGGFASMSIKTIAVTVGISAVVLLGGLAIVHRSMNGGPGAAADGERTEVTATASRTLAKPRTPPAVARPPGQEDAPPNPALTATDDSLLGDTEVADSDSPAAHPPSSPASEEALAVREAFRVLKQRYGDGGAKGWRAVGLDIAPLEEMLLVGPEGFREFLALLDEEADDAFLEALLHHLPLARTDSQQGILDSRELHQEIWARYDEAETPERRTAFLRFFAFNRGLSSARMNDFLALARNEPDRQVRQLAVDAIASNPDLIASTWEVLAHALENDPDPQCRETAIQGLAHGEEEGARELVKAAFSSPDERLRAAAVGSAAGDPIPEEVTGGDAAAYLIGEFRVARTARYKKVILKRFVGNPREAFGEEIRRALPEEKDMELKKAYNEALEMMEEARAARPSRV